VRVLIVEDEPYLAEAIRDGLRLEAIAADIAGDGDTALELLGINAYDIAVLDRDIPGPSGDQVAQRIVASGSGMPILMLTAADRLDDKASGFGLGADDYLTKPEGGVVSAEELLERAWDENADPFTNAVRITVSALRKRLGDPGIIATVAGVGYRIDTERSLSERADDTERHEFGFTFADNH
jgi:DNA-binding response OmpR family regulator